MKTYLPQIERRIFVRQNQAWGILNYDADNAYPQRMLELVGQSPTAKDCWNKRTAFITGRGFEIEDLADEIVNDKNGLTLGKLHKNIAKDKALFTGFGIHINYNANFRISSVNYVKFEDIRMGDPDNPDKANKYAVYFDWGRKTWKNITTSRIAYLDKYNPDPEVIKQQVIDAGGWDKYKGQLFYSNPEIDDYPLIEADSVWEDFETEAGIKVFNNREVTTGFLPSTILFMKQRREEGDNANPESDENYLRLPSQMEKDLGAFQGAKNSQKIVVIEYDDDDSKPEFNQYAIQNNDKLFEATEKSVEARIIKGFSVPAALVGSNLKTGLADQGSVKKQAIQEFNDNTANDRTDLSVALEKIFANFWRPINPKNNWNTIPVPAEVAEDVIGTKAGVALNQLLMANIPAENKIQVLIYAYGFKEDEAHAMANGIPTPKEAPVLTNNDNTK